MSKQISMLTIMCMIAVIGCSQQEEKTQLEDDVSKMQIDSMDPKEHKEVKSEPVIKVDKITQQFESLTLDEKIGQMLMVGFEGQIMNPEIEEYIDKYHVGGFILFERNISSTEQVQALITSIKEKNQANIPLFFSLDEEGGRVTRLPKTLQAFPDARTIGNLNDPTISYDMGALMAKQLKGLGFNMNNAPVLDVDSNSKNPIIGARSFGPSPEIVIKHALPFMRGHKDEWIIPVVKHFPGHGDTFVDSHKELPIINKELEQLKELELKPFKAAFNKGADAVMLAHILLPKIDNKYPSSLSKAFISDLLRKEMKFDGVAITDDLTMKAITNDYEVSEAALQSVRAGIDILLICHEKENIVSTFKLIKQAVEDGVLTEERINESVYRILKLKEKYKLQNEGVNGDIEEVSLMIKQYFSELN